MTALRVYYGTIEKNIDITDRVFQTLLVEKHLVFPADDNLRAELFSDPCFRVVKHIIISGLSNTLFVIDHKTVCAIDTRTNTILSDPALMRRLITKTALKPMHKVLALHSLLSLDHGSMRDEFPEQCMVMEFLTGKETVLEIGGNIGRNSLILSSILESDQQLVVLECSTAISEQLQQNRSNNQLQFHIENAALSKTKLIQKKWRTIASDTVLDGYTEIKNTTFAELESKYHLQFDTLVLDCEGSFHPILHDFPEILTNIHTIIVENDYLTLREKEEVDAILQTSGFQCIYVKEGEEEAKYLKMACLSNFYEVWKKPTQSMPLERCMHKGAPFMEKYPHVLFFRYDKYSAIDSLFDEKEKMECSMQIISDPKELYQLYDSNYHVFVTYGKEEKEYHKDVYQVIASRMGKRWIHYQEIPSLEQFVSAVNSCYIHHVLSDRVETRPIFSIFTTCYKSYDKITRAYQSILAQRLRDWEWVILDDSPDDAHFAFLKKKFHLEKRVRLYKRSCNSGNIGNVKNEAVGLCRGKYVLEMDHDDEILPDTLLDAMRAFSDKEVGFVYMDFINEYENGKNFWYSDFICKGYGGYYRQKYRNKWVDVYMTPNINNITLSHIVCLPNHPRIWRRETLLKIGNYSEFLPICDDQELIMRTALQTKMVKIPKLAYVQYMNDNNNNFSLIRNREINRLGPQFIVPQFYNMYQVHDKMKEKGAYEDEKYIDHASKLWTRGEYEHKYCNERIQYDYDMQYCILGCTTFLKNIALLQEEYKNPRVDFLLLDGAGNTDALCQFLDSVNCSRMKCYSLSDTPTDQLKKYFHDLYRCCEKVQIIE